MASWTTLLDAVVGKCTLGGGDIPATIFAVLATHDPYSLGLVPWAWYRDYGNEMTSALAPRHLALADGAIVVMPVKV